MELPYFREHSNEINKKSVVDNHPNRKGGNFRKGVFRSKDIEQPSEFSQSTTALCPSGSKISLGTSVLNGTTAATPEYLLCRSDSYTLSDCST